MDWDQGLKDNEQECLQNCAVEWPHKRLDKWMEEVGGDFIKK